MNKNIRSISAGIFILMNGWLMQPNACAQAIMGTSPIAEPYPYVSSGSFSGSAIAQSPDPLVSYRWPNPQAGNGLEIYLQKPEIVSTDKAVSFENLSSLTGNSPNVTVKGTGSIKVDFGRVSAAWLEFDSPDLSGNVEMSISEYNEPSRANVYLGPAHPFKTAVPVKYGTTYRLELNSEYYEGVRFGWIHIRSFVSAWHITGIRLVCETKPANYNGSFSCSDTLLTRIWYNAAYTVKLNLMSTYFGSVLLDRGDRHSWTGDAYTTQAASLVAFANYDFIKKNLSNTANDNNGIRSYTLYWVQSLIDYYNYTGDVVTLRTYIPNACAKLNDAYAVYGTNPGLGFYGWDERLGAGFENASCQEAQNAYKMLSIRVWKEFALAMEKAGRNDLRDKYSQYATDKIAQIRKNTSWFQSYGLHAGADAITTDLLSPSEQKGMYDKDFSNRINRLSFSPFNQFFILQAYARMNKYDDALGSIRDLWGGAIKYGGTTVFEVYRPCWNAIVGQNGAVPNNQAGYTSLCHPWAAGITKWLSEEILGIKPTSPGFATYEVLPHLGRTLTSVAGKTPTPLGDICAGFDVSTGICNITSPVGSIGRIGIPKVEKNISRIKINGAIAWDGVYHSVPGIGGASEDSVFVYFTDVQPGMYSLLVSYSGTTPTYTDPFELYPAKFVKTDSITSGNWGNVYGRDGYVLVNYNGSGIDKRSLPSYISSVTVPMSGNFHPNDCIWKTGINDKRAPANDSGNTGSRNAACWYSSDCPPSFSFNVSATGTKEYQVALYFVDWDNKERRVAVEMLDANTLNLIAPVRIVTDFYGGKYLIFSYNKSAKFRINQVRGDNAVLSGIFFDPVDLPDTTSTGISNTTACEKNSLSLFGSIHLTSRHAEISFTTKNINENIEANLFDTNGIKTVKLLSGQFTGTNQITRSYSELIHGVYILQVKVNNNKVISKKFLIDK